MFISIAGLRHECPADLIAGLFANEQGVFHALLALGFRRLHVEFDPSRTSRETHLAVLARAGLGHRPAAAANPLESGEKHDLG